jgi:hypothetical protein
MQLRTITEIIRGSCERKARRSDGEIGRKLGKT